MLFIARPFSAAAYSAAVLSAGAVGYWRLGELSGATANDELGNHHGTYSGATLNVPGIPGAGTNTAASFTGTGTSKITITNDTTLALFENYTYECWFNGSDGVTNTLIFGTYNGNTNVGTGLGCFSNNVFGTYRGGLVTFPAAVAFNGAWHHLVCTFARVGANIVEDLYLDGALVNTFTTSPTTNVGPVLGMAHYLHNSSGFNGSIDECAIYPTVLLAAQISDHYNKGTA